MSKDKTLKLGFIGCGTIFRKAHLPSSLKVEGLEVVGFYDIDRNQSLAAFELFKQHLIDQNREGIISDDELTRLVEQATIYDSTEEMLENVDIVDICTPVKWHSTYAAMALKAGVHVMSEKPMARSVISAQNVVDAANVTGALYQLNDDNVFLPRYQIIRNIIESNAIGDIEACWIARGSHGPEARSWFWNPSISGGGCLLDYGTHAVTSLWYLIGLDKRVLRVKSDGIRTSHITRPIGFRLQPIEVDDDAHFRVLFEDPVTKEWISVFIEATWSWAERGADSSDVRGFIRIVGTEGELTGFIDEEGNDFIRITRPGFGDKLVPVPPTRSEEVSFINEIANFVDCVRSGNASVLDQSVGLRVMEVLNAAYLSEYLGRKSVTVEELYEYINQHQEEDREDTIVDKLVGFISKRS